MTKSKTFATVMCGCGWIGRRKIGKLARCPECGSFAAFQPDSPKHRPEHIVYRFKPCNCGCGGKDPWHASTFKRIVRNILSEESGKLITKDGYAKQYRAVGYVRLPMSSKPVMVGDCSPEGSKVRFWVVNYSELEHDK